MAISETTCVHLRASLTTSTRRVQAKVKKLWYVRWSIFDTWVLEVPRGEVDALLHALFFKLTSYRHLLHLVHCALHIRSMQAAYVPDIVWCVYCRFASTPGVCIRMCWPLSFLFMSSWTTFTMCWVESDLRIGMHDAVDYNRVFWIIIIINIVVENYAEHFSAICGIGFTLTHPEILIDHFQSDQIQ